MRSSIRQVSENGIGGSSLRCTLTCRQSSRSNLSRIYPVCTLSLWGKPPHPTCFATLASRPLPASGARWEQAAPFEYQTPPLSAARHQPHRIRAIGVARLIEQRNDGSREGGVLGERRLDDAAALLLDRQARIAILLDGAVALPQNGITDGVAHRVLQLARPGIERVAVQEDRPRYVEVAGERVEGMELVHAVGHRVGERVLLRVYGAGLDAGDCLGEVAAQRLGAEQRKGFRLDVARQHADAHA